MKFTWPSSFKGAVSLTFDDGLPSQLKFGIPLLEKYGFKGTFYINPTAEDQLRIWKEVADNGHEIGNHSLTHPCSCNFPWYQDNRSGLENMSLGDIRSDIVEAQNRIRRFIPVGGRTFAYPCYQTSVGRGLNKKSYIPIVAEIFIAARSGGTGFPNSPLVCDLHELWSCSADRMSIEEIVGLIIRTACKGRWVIFTFHGINEGHMPVSEYNLTAFLEFLEEQRDEIWVAPVVEVAEYIIEERKRLGINL